jgi:DNA modification methylase
MGNTLTGQDWSLVHGDCRVAFLGRAAGSVHTIVTSPPYWGGVRDYGIGPSVWGDGWEGCFGNEPTVEGYVAHTLEVFEALGHALREDGVIWWNIGDCYSAGGRTGYGPGTNKGQPKDGKRQSDPSLAAGNKCLVPYRVALALQEAGWVVRQDVIWRKPSPMPESIDGWRWERCRVKVADGGTPRRGDASETGIRNNHHDSRGLATWAECPGCDKCRASDGYVLRKGSWRPTTAHEFVFQIVKSPEYFCDAAAAGEIASGRSPGNLSPKVSDNNTKADQIAALAPARVGVETRNPRSVWTISSEAYKGKHFAAFPTMLAWKCIQASTSSAGCCAECGSQYAPVVEKGRVATRPGNDTKTGEFQVLDPDSPYQGQPGTIVGNRDPQRHIAVKRTLGYRATCNCNAGDPVPCVVADPFTGSGTVLQVATNTGRQFFGSEIAEHYLPLIQERAATPWVPKTEKRPSVKRRKKLKRERLLFG